MKSFEIFMEKKAHDEFMSEGIISLNTYTTLMECGFDPDELENKFQFGYTPSDENFVVNIGCTQEDIEDLLTAVIGNNIERMIDIKTACDLLTEEKE